MKYKNEYAPDLTDLEKLVNVSMENGWEVQGNVFVLRTPCGNWDFFQTMIKEEEVIDKKIAPPIPAPPPCRRIKESKDTPESTTTEV